MNHKRVNIPFDTGASHSFIDKILIDKGKLVGKKKEKITTATGKCFSVGNTIESIWIDQKPYQMEFQVIFPLSKDIILGRDFMLKNKVEIDFGGKTIKFGKNIITTGNLIKDFGGYRVTKLDDKEKVADEKICSSCAES
jgi:hypothetical protein